jgi:ATP-binding cassette subfamily F protein uup
LELQVKTTRQGGKVLDAKRIRRAFGEQLIVSDFSYSFKRGEKIGIIGKNGTGKSTLLNMLTGREGIDRGALEMGETTVVGYYTQEDIPVRENQRLIEAVTEIAESIELADGSKISASQFLQMFMFPPSRNYALVENLSGGERRRLQLLKILIKNPNFLVLDEPTNDLDIGTLNVLENFLVHFKGTLILVSHDRYFMDRLVDHLFVFEGEGEIRDFPGNYTDWREQRDAETAAKQNAPKIVAAPAAIAETKPTPTDAPSETAFKRNRTYKEQREYDTLSAEMAALETEKATLEASIANPMSHNDIAPAAARLSAIAVQLDEIELRWLELDEWGAYGS